MESHLIRRQSLSDEVKKVLKEYIYSMDPHESTKLPSENEIAQNYGVSRVTVRKVLDELEQEGLIIRIHGRGTFVNSVATQMNVSLIPAKDYAQIIKDSGNHPDVKLLRCQSEVPSKEVQRGLNLSSEEKVLRVEKVFSSDGYPSLLCVDLIPVSLVGEKINQSLWAIDSTFKVLRNCFHIDVKRDCISFEAVSKRAAKKETKACELLDADALLKISGYCYDQDNKPVSYGVDYYDTKYIRYHMVRNAEY